MIRAGVFAVRGAATGMAVVLDEPLSFWGGVDAVTGVVIDQAHPALGTMLAETILVMACGRGSSSSSSVLAELIRIGKAPHGIVLARPDPILTVGALVAQTLYGSTCPILVAPIEGLATGDQLRLFEKDGMAVLALRPPAQEG